MKCRNCRWKKTHRVEKFGGVTLQNICDSPKLPVLIIKPATCVYVWEHYCNGDLFKQVE